MNKERRQEITDLTEKAEINSKHLQPAVCITLSVEDLISRGYNPSSLNQQEFEHLARKIGEDCMETWWQAMEGRADDNPKISSFATIDEMDAIDDDDDDDDEFKHTREFVENNATPEQ